MAAYTTSKKSGCDEHEPPKLQLVIGSSGGLAAGGTISDDLQSSIPKEIGLTGSEMDCSEKSPEHLQAIQDVGMYRTGLMTATELRMLHPKTYKNWDDMKQRCKGDTQSGKPSIPLHSSFHEFAEFLEIMGPRPYPTWSLDRIDPTGPYSPDNLRWASKTTQSRNRTNTIYLTSRGGIRRPLVEWAEILGVKDSVLRARRQAKWSDAEIIEGKRLDLSGMPLNHDSNLGSPFNYTPWPLDLREVLEHYYQRNKFEGEDRLSFLLRYSRKRRNEVSQEADSVCWPESYVPSEIELFESEELTRAYTVWSRLYTYAQRKFTDGGFGRLHLRRTIPRSAEDKLRAYIHPVPLNFPRRWWECSPNYR